MSYGSFLMHYLQGIQSPVLSLKRQQQVLEYVTEMKGENGVTEKSIDQIKVELDIEENGAELAPMSAQRKQMQNTALRQVSNYRNNQGSAQKKSSYGGILGSPHSTGHAATQDFNGYGKNIL